MVYHSGNTSAPETEFLVLDKTNATSDYPAWNDTLPTSTVFSLGTDSTVNASGVKYVAYVFADVEGYSKFGVYTGNGLVDGTYVYTGFKPELIICKPTTALRNWDMKSTGVNPFNTMTKTFYANDGAAVQTQSDTDFLSNGFKFRTTADINLSGVPTIYFAWAKNPFGGDSTTPSTAV